MRLVRLKIDPQVGKLLNSIAQQFKFDDTQIVEDLFALMRFKGAGLPDKDGIKKLSVALSKKSGKSQPGLMLLLSKRQMLFLTLVKTKYFQALSLQPDLVTSVQRFCTYMTLAYRKHREAKCLSCHLKPNCNFGMQYGDSARDITKVIDPNFALKVPVDCPSLPEITALNQIYSAGNMISNLVNSDKSDQALLKDPRSNNPSGAEALSSVMANMPSQEDMPSDESADDEGDFIPREGVSGSSMPGKCSTYDATHTGDHVCKVTEAFITKVTTTALAIFELGDKFSIALGGKSKRKKKSVDFISHDKAQRTIKSEGDITKLVSSQYGLPKEVFEQRLAKKSLVKQDNLDSDDKKKLIYLLVDASGSMGGQLGNNAFSLFTRGSFATCMASAIVKNALKDKGLIFFRTFAGVPLQMQRAFTLEEGESLRRFIAATNYNGGDTDIPAALICAINDITSAAVGDKIRESEILIITDCEDRIDEVALKKFTDQHEINVLDVSGDTSPNLILKRLSAKYMKVDVGAPDITKMVNEVV